MKKKSLIMSSIALGLVALTFLLSLLPIIESASPIDWMEFGLKMFEADAMFAICIGLGFLFGFIGVIVLLLANIAEVLFACGVIKNEKIAKIVRLANIIIACVVAVAYFAAFLYFAFNDAFSVALLFITIFAIAVPAVLIYDKMSSKKAQ